MFLVAMDMGIPVGGVRERRYAHNAEGNPEVGTAWKRSGSARCMKGIFQYSGTDRDPLGHPLTTCLLRLSPGSSENHTLTYCWIPTGMFRRDLIHLLDAVVPLAIEDKPALYINKNI
ncbi:hypothetical protein Trydic_g18246 [Trypoxylus dichotomus]